MVKLRVGDIVERISESDNPEYWGVKGNKYKILSISRSGNLEIIKGTTADRREFKLISREDYRDGDWVEVLPREDDWENEGPGYVDDMLFAVGKKYKISNPRTNTLYFKGFLWKKHWVKPYTPPMSALPTPTPIPQLDYKELPKEWVEDIAKKYCEINKKAVPYVVKKVVFNIVKYHKNLNNSLGLTLENNFRLKIDVKKDHNDIIKSVKQESRCMYFLMKLAGAKTWTADFKEMMVENKKGVKQKISRVVSTIINTKKAQEYISLIMGSSDWSNKNFLQKFGEKVKQNDGVWISTNPFDLMTPSDNCNFTSCHRVHGEFSQTAITNAIQDFSFQVITTSDIDTFKKDGRIWAFSDGLGWYARAGYYGTMSECEYETVDKWINSRLNIKEDTDLVIYLKDYNGYNDGFAYTAGTIKEKQLYCRLPTCLTCGNTWENSERDYKFYAQCDECAYEEDEDYED